MSYPWLAISLSLSCASVPCDPIEACVPRCEGDSCPSAPPPCPVAAVGEVVINEVLADPGGVDTNSDGASSGAEDEFIEVLSRAPHPVTLAGARVVVDGHDKLVFDDRCLAPGDALVVFGGGSAVPGWVGATGLMASSRLLLANDGARVELVSDAGMLDSVTLGPAEPGRSIARSPDATGAFTLHPSQNGDTQSSTIGACSPGLCTNGAAFPGCDVPPQKADAVTSSASCPAAGYGEVVLNEVLADPGGVDANGDLDVDSRRDEFVELMIVSTAPRRLDGIELRVGEDLRSQVWTPCLQSGATLVIYSGGMPVLGPWFTGPALVADRPLGLANDGATVELWQDQERIDRLIYSEAPRGQSLVRYPDGLGDFVEHSTLPGGLMMSPGTCTNGGPSRIDCAIR